MKTGNNYGMYFQAGNIEDAIHNTRALDGQSEKRESTRLCSYGKKQMSVISCVGHLHGRDGFPGWHLECFGNELLNT